VPDLIGGKPLRTIVGFGVPITIANLAQQSYLLADSAIVGHHVGIDGLAAVSAAQPIQYLATSVFLGIVTGFAIRIAGMKGAGDERGIAVAAKGLTVSVLTWSLLCTAVTFLLAEPLLSLMGIRGDVAVLGRQFLLILALGYVATFGVSAVTVFARSLGDSRRPMYVQVLGSGLNLALAWLFVAVLGLGVRGAGLATVITDSVNLVVILTYMRRRYPLARHSASWAEVWRETKGALGLGVPIAIQHGLIAVGVMVLVWIIQPLGTAVLAAVTVVSRLETFTAMVFLDLSAALTMFVAQNGAAGMHDRVRDGLRRSLFATLGATGVMSIVVLAAADPIALVFTRDDATRDVITRYIHLTYPFFLLYTVMVVLHGYLNGRGRTVAPLVCTVLSFVVVRMALSYELRGPYGLDGIIWAVPIGWLVGAIHSGIVTSPRRSRTRGGGRAQESSDSRDPVIP